MMIVYYKFPDFKGKNGRLKTGYTSIEITNGSGKIDADDPDQVALAGKHGGILNEEIPAKPKKGSKS